MFHLLKIIMIVNIYIIQVYLPFKGMFIWRDQMIQTV